MPAEAVSAGHGLDVTTVTGVFTHNLKGIEDGQGRAVVVEGEGLVNVGEGGRRHGEHDTPHPYRGDLVHETRATSLVAGLAPTILDPIREAAPASSVRHRT